MALWASTQSRSRVRRIRGRKNCGWTILRVCIRRCSPCSSDSLQSPLSGCEARAKRSSMTSIRFHLYRSSLFQQEASSGVGPESGRSSVCWTATGEENSRRPITGHGCQNTKSSIWLILTGGMPRRLQGLLKNQTGQPLRSGKPTPYTSAGLPTPELAAVPVA